MDPTAWRRVKDVVAGALDRSGPERAAYLDEACGGDAELRAEVESLLGAYSRAGTFIERPAVLQLTTTLEGDGSAAPLDDPNLGRALGPYVIEDVIGRGGMGTVYRGRRADREFEQRVAIKMIRRGMDSELVVRRFRHERQILASLDHPNIGRLFDGGTSADGLPYFVMEFVDGLPIDRYADDRQLSTVDRLRLCLGVFDAVQHAHDRAIVHRDLKPTNVLVTAAGHAKLLDFGIAKILDTDGDGASTFTHVARPMTPDYASPEQIQGRPITPATDVYALGLLLYELLTGHRPFRFDGRTADERARVVCEDDPARPSDIIDRHETTQREDGETVTVTADTVAELRDGTPAELRRRLSGDLDAIVLKALRKEPGERYGSVAAFADDIKRYLDARPVGASRDSWRYQVTRRIRRSRRALATAALIVLTIGLTALAMRQVRPPASTPTADAVDGAAATAPTAPAAATRRSVAVIGFRNLSGAPADAWLSTAIAEMLTTELAGDGQLRAVSADRAARALRDLNPAAGATAPGLDDAATLTAVRNALGVDYVVLGTFATAGAGAGAGRTLRLDVRVQSAPALRAAATTAAPGGTAGGDDTAGLLAGAASQGDEAQLFALVADAGRQLRERLGLKASTAESMTAARAAFPASLEATRLYAEGTARLRVLDAATARERLEQAAALEPKNPLIQMALASAWTALGYDARAAEAAQRAFAAAAPLGREERLTVEGRFYEATQQWPKAADVYRTLWGFFSDNIEYGLQLAAAQTSSGRGKEALETIDALRTLPSAQTDPRLDIQEGQSAAALGDFKRELVALQRAVAGAERLNARGLLARAHLLEGRSHHNQGQPTEAKAAMEQARALFEAIGDRAGVASVLNSLGTVLSDEQQLASGAAMYEASLRAAEEIGDRKAMSAALNNLGLVLKDERRYDAALKAHERALALRREIGERNWTAVSLSNIGVVYFEQDRFEKAATYYRQSLDLAREIGDKRGQVRAQHNLAIVSRELGRLPEAQQQFEAALAVRREIGDKRGQVITLVELGLVQLAQANPAAARQSVDAALLLARETRVKPGEAQALFQLGEIALVGDDLTLARQHHEAALAMRREFGETRTVAESEAALAALAFEEGRPADAEAAAARLLQGLGDEPAVPLRVPLHLLTARARLAARDMAGATRALQAAQGLARDSERTDLKLGLTMVEAEVALARGETRFARQLLTGRAAALTANGPRLADFERRLLLARVDRADRQPSATAALQALEGEAQKAGALLIAKRAKTP